MGSKGFRFRVLGFEFEVWGQRVLGFEIEGLGVMNLAGLTGRIAFFEGSYWKSFELRRPWGYEAGFLESGTPEP